MDNMRDSVVQIKNNSFVGSGIVVSGNNVLTCAHVLDGSDNTIVTNNGSQTESEVIYVNADADMAVIKGKALQNICPINPGDSASLSKGDPIVAIGYPQSPSHESSPSVARGAVTDIGYPVEIPNSQNRSVPYQYVLTDVPVSKGYSGGPLLTEQGAFVGMITSRLDGTDKPSTLALSSNSVFDILQGVFSNSHPYEKSVSSL